MLLNSVGIGTIARRGAQKRLIHARSQLKQFQRSVKTSTLDWKPIKSVSGNLSLLEQQAKSPKLRAFFLGLMLAMPIISFWLGCWQVKRLKWKTDLIAKCENALAQPSMDDLPAVLDPSVIPDFEYRRFKVKGHFDYDNEMFLGPRIKDGVAGYLVVTPFVRSSGGKPILIERGWIHKDMVIPERRKTGYLSHLAMPQGEIEIEALFRIMPTRSSIQFEHEMGSRVFHFPDVPAMAEQSGSLPIYCQMIYDLRDHIEWKKEKKDDNASKKKSSILGLLVHSKDQNVTDDDAFIAKLAEQDETLQFQEFEFIKEGVPIAATPKIKLNNNHMQYLVTWFGVSFASTVLLLYNVWKTRQFSSADKIIAAKRQGKI